MFKRKIPIQIAIQFAIMWLLIAYAAFGQDDNPYGKIAHDVRQIAIGVDGAGNNNSLSATVIVPFGSDKVTGWAGGFAQQQSVGDEITAQVINGHATAEYEFTDRLGINAFGDWTRDKERGIAGQTQIGAFFSVDLYEDFGWEVHGGAGNFVENKQAREDLGLEDTDPNVVRALAYIHAGYGRYIFLYRFTPQIDFSDLQFTLEPTANYELSDTLNLVLKAKLGYETEPLVEGEEFYTSYQIQVGAKF